MNSSSGIAERLLPRKGLKLRAGMLEQQHGKLHGMIFRQSDPCRRFSEIEPDDLIVFAVADHESQFAFIGRIQFAVRIFPCVTKAEMFEHLGLEFRSHGRNHLDDDLELFRIGHATPREYSFFSGSACTPGMLALSPRRSISGRMSDISGAHHSRGTSAGSSITGFQRFLITLPSCFGTAGAVFMNGSGIVAFCSRSTWATCFSPARSAALAWSSSSFCWAFCIAFAAAASAFCLISSCSWR